MKKKALNILMAAFVFSLFTAVTAQAKDIVIFNETNFEIRGVYMSSADDQSWGENLLGSETLSPGEGLKISISGTPNNLDLALVDDEKQELEFSKLDFSDFESLTLFTDGTGRFD
ncbi:hypothetical protein [Maridesulfovibrio sp.]|uniref:hypothetical protein n=1 Tax=Maridesulfovibrio sp. TaxID=2795000 RepID=UPI002A187D80|nr:hypothetical protein [Maridesulfovibrio sp.]